METSHGNLAIALRLGLGLLGTLTSAIVPSTWQGIPFEPAAVELVDWVECHHPWIRECPHRSHLEHLRPSTHCNLLWLPSGTHQHLASAGYFAQEFTGCARLQWHCRCD